MHNNDLFNQVRRKGKGSKRSRGGGAATKWFTVAIAIVIIIILILIIIIITTWGRPARARWSAWSSAGGRDGGRTGLDTRGRQSGPPGQARTPQKRLKWAVNYFQRVFYGGNIYEIDPFKTILLRREGLWDMGHCGPFSFNTWCLKFFYHLVLYECKTVR